MIATVHTISLVHLAVSLLPVVIVLFIQYRWSLNYQEGIYAVGRMLGQLMIIGYFLGYIFNANSAWIILFVLIIMVLASSWIALRTVPTERTHLYAYVLVSLLMGGGVTLALVTQGVLDLSPWYQPRYMIPLAGMIFANAMNCISLAAERHHDETKRGADLNTARNVAFRTSLIPITNSLFAVGLVSLPGMMTGQILSGVDPLIAARYQIMVMAMIYGSGGISSAVYLSLIMRKH